MAKKPQRFGGSFAPAFTDENLAAYRTLIDGLDPQSPARDAMDKLHKMAMAWWEQPESTGDGKPHPSGRGVIVDLDEPIAKALWESIPWDHELEAFAQLFDGIDPVTQPVLRNAAHHLLWLGWELFRDREPITVDKL